MSYRLVAVAQRPRRSRLHHRRRRQDRHPRDQVCRQPAVSNYRLHGLMQTSTMNFLSFFKTSDVYDPDRLASDEEAIRKYYMKNGYADFRITNTDVAYQDNPAGYIITITMDEGPQYHVSGVTVISQHPEGGRPGACCSSSALRAGDVYNAAAVEKSVEAITRDVARQGYAFSEVRPHGERDTGNHQIAVCVHRRRRSEGLYRAHRNRRQHPHARLRHSPRVRYRRRRPLQPRDDRAGRAPPQQSRLLQEGAYLEPAGLGARSRHRRRRGRGSADRLDQPQRRLFDDRRASSPSSRTPRPTFSAAASM